MIKKKKQIDIAELLPGVKKNISLKDYTTFKIGGKAKYFFVARTEKDLILAINSAKKINLPFYILGAGSNVLIKDRGFEGLVIRIQNTKYTTKGGKIMAAAGGP